MARGRKKALPGTSAKELKSKLLKEFKSQISTIGGKSEYTKLIQMEQQKFGLRTRPITLTSIHRMKKAEVEYHLSQMQELSIVQRYENQSQWGREAFEKFVADFGDSLDSTEVGKKLSMEILKELENNPLYLNDFYEVLSTQDYDKYDHSALDEFMGDSDESYDRMTVLIANTFQEMKKRR